MALEAVMTNAIELSMDQYASKVIEKAIKTSDSRILSLYLDAITSKLTPDLARTRTPLIDIACDQYGNVRLNCC